MYQKIFKKDNCDNKYLSHPDLGDNKFEVLCSEIVFYKVDLVCVETVKAKPTGNYSVFVV